ncbi:MAG: hypothetical protein FJX77_14090 [Armatimonadetes bacterium]|nr:hypothetical protein [Armatimonadota bacterium]
MRDVYARYRFSSYAGKALQWLADWHLAQGRPEAARACYARMFREPDLQPASVVRYALAAAATGATAETKETLGLLRGRMANQTLLLAGQRVTGAAAAAQLEKELRPLPPPGERDWRSFGGPDATRAMPGRPTRTFSRRWAYTYPASLPRTQSSQRFSYYSSTPRNRFSYLNFPVRHGNQVFIQTPRQFVSVDAATGAERWNQSDFVLTREEMPADPQAPNSNYSSRASRTFQAAPVLSGRRVYARVPLAQSEREVGRWPADIAIAAYDAATGAPIWRRLALGDPRGTFYNLPLVQGGLVVSGSASLKGGITEYSLVVLDAGTGEPLWTTYLGAGSDPLAYVDGSPPLLCDGVLWIETALYTLSAVDLISGEIRHIYRYPPSRQVGYGGRMDGGLLVANEPISLIGAARGPIVFCPRWGQDAVAIDPGQGRLLWAAPKASRGSTVGVLIGLTERNAIICGDQVQALQLSDGQRQGIWEPEAGSGPVGVAALCGDRICIPVDNKIHVVGADNLRPIEVLDFSRVLGEGPGFLTATMVGDLLLVAGADRVFALGDAPSATVSRSAREWADRMQGE